MYGPIMKLCGLPGRRELVFIFDADATEKVCVNLGHDNERKLLRKCIVDIEIERRTQMRSVVSVRAIR